MDNNSTILDILLGVKELLSDKSRWTKEAYCRDINGYERMFMEDDAVSYCLKAAIFKTASDMEDLDMSFRNDCFVQLEALVKKTTGFINIAQFNDNITTKHKEVIGILDLAIKQRIAMKTRGDDNG